MRPFFFSILQWSGIRNRERITYNQPFAKWTCPALYYQKQWIRLIDSLLTWIPAWTIRRNRELITSDQRSAKWTGPALCCQKQWIRLIDSLLAWFPTWTVREWDIRKRENFTFVRMLSYVRILHFEIKKRGNFKSDQRLMSAMYVNQHFSCALTWFQLWFFARISLRHRELLRTSLRGSRRNPELRWPFRACEVRCVLPRKLAERVLNGRVLFGAANLAP